MNLLSDRKIKSVLRFRHVRSILGECLIDYRKDSEIVNPGSRKTTESSGKLLNFYIIQNALPKFGSSENIKRYKS